MIYWCIKKSGEVYFRFAPQFVGQQRQSVIGALALGLSFAAVRTCAHECASGSSDSALDPS